MSVSPSILCPIDFSEASAGTLRFASGIAAHVGGRVVVLSVEDPLLTEAIALGTGGAWNPADTKREIEEFVARTTGDEPAAMARFEYDVAVGKPAPEILRVARDRSSINVPARTASRVCASCSSTTERVPARRRGPCPSPRRTIRARSPVEDARRLLGRIVVPVDPRCPLCPDTARAGSAGAGC